MKKAEIVQKKCVLISVSKSLKSIEKRYFDECYFYGGKYSLRIPTSYGKYYTYYCEESQPFYIKEGVGLVIDFSKEEEAAIEAVTNLIKNRSRLIDERKKDIKRTEEEITFLKSIIRYTNPE